MQLEERVDKLEEDMYFGRGKDNPSMTTRMDRVEVAAAKIDKLTWVIIVGIIAALGDAITHHFH